MELGVYLGMVFFVIIAWNCFNDSFLSTSGGNGVSFSNNGSVFSFDEFELSFSLLRHSVLFRQSSS